MASDVDDVLDWDSDDSWEEVFLKWVDEMRMLSVPQVQGEHDEVFEDDVADVHDGVDWV